VPENDRVVLGHHSLRSDSLAAYSRDLLGAATRTLCSLIGEVKLGAFDPDGTRSGWLLQQAGSALGSGLDENQAYWAEAAEADEDKEGTFLVSSNDSEPGQVPWDEGSEAPGLEELEHYAPVGDDEIEQIFDEQPSAPSEATGGAPPRPEEEDFELSTSSSSSSLTVESSGEECEEQFVQRQSNEAILHVSPEIPGPLLQNRRSKVLHKWHEVKKDVALCGLRVSVGYVELPHGATFQWPRCSKCFRGEVLGNKSDLIGFLDQRSRSQA
jgi:hypothetical protein